jgi:hypothetical protein
MGKIEVSINPNVVKTTSTSSLTPLGTVPMICAARRRSHVLPVRAPARVEVVDDVPPEYLVRSRAIVGHAQFPAFEEQVRGLYERMARIAIEPTWAKLLDFETRLPRAVEQLVNR